MGLAELMQFVDSEKDALLRQSGEVADVYRSLVESLRTLPICFRESFVAESIHRAPGSPPGKISFARPTLRSSEGEVHDNTRWLLSIINNLQFVRTHHLADPYFIELPDIADIRLVHEDVRTFLEEVYRQNSAWMLRDPASEAVALARQKRKDVEDLLTKRIEPFVERLGQLRADEYSLLLRREIREHISSLASYEREPGAGDALIKDTCARAGLAYDPGLVHAVLQNLEVTDESLDASLRQKYASAPEIETPPAVSPATLRHRYLHIVYRYLARVSELGRLLPVLEMIYAVFQPPVSVVARMGRFFAALFGKQYKTPRRDVEFSYIIGREVIERRRASLESLIAEVNLQEKHLLRVKSTLATAKAAKSLHRVSPSQLREAIDSTRLSMRRIYDDGFGLVQWLGKKGNQDRLARVPEGSQRDLSVCLERIYSTLIVNSERLAEIAKRYPGEGAAGP